MAIKTGRTDQQGIPSYNVKTCTQCGLCAKVCKSEILIFENKQLKIMPDSAFGCIACGHCMAICPSNSIVINGRDLTEADMVKMPAKNRQASFTALNGLLLKRRSVREFKDREVEQEVIDKILDATSTAPMGIPPSDVGIVVLNGKEKVHKFAQDIINLYHGSKKILNPWMLKGARPFIGRESYETFTSFIIPLIEKVSQAWEEGEDWLLYDAPLAMIFHVSSYSDPVDANIAATYSTLAAEALGLGSCMIGSVSPFLSRNKKVMEKWGVPKKNKLGLVVIFGYSDVKYKKAVKRRFASVRYA